MRIGAAKQSYRDDAALFDTRVQRGWLLTLALALVAFPFMAGGRQRAKVAKRWSGGFSEVLTDRDDFLVEFTDPTLTNSERLLVLAAAIHIDLTWFERKR